MMHFQKNNLQALSRLPRKKILQVLGIFLGTNTKTAEKELFVLQRTNTVVQS